MQVVWRSDDGDNNIEMVFAQPDDFFLPTDTAVIVAVSAGTLANGEAVLDDPSEVSRGNP